MYKKKLLVGLLALTGVASVTAALLWAARPQTSDFAFSTGDEYGIVMDKDNTLTLTSEPSAVYGEVLTKNGNEVSMAFNGAKVYSDGVAILNSMGSIANTSLIKGIEAITVEFTGELIVSFSADKTSFTASETLTSNTKYALAKTYDYFRLIATAETSIVSITIKHSCNTRFTLDEDKRLEGELGLLDRQRCWSDDDRASNGAYAKDVNDCGQGMYFRYYAFEAGDRDITVNYATGSPNSKMSLFVNGTYATDVVYTQNTGWFGDNGGNTAAVTISDVTLVQGWNELYLIKNGTDSDNPSYGGWAQIDYITVAGTNKRFDLSEFNMTSTVYTLEAEVGHWHWSNSDRRPERWNGNFSMGYGLGNIDAEGDGVKYDIEIAETGTYAIRPVAGGNRYMKVSIDDGALTEYNFGAYCEWNEPAIADANICVVELEAGFHYIDFQRTGRDSGSGWFTLDKVVFEKVA